MRGKDRWGWGDCPLSTPGQFFNPICCFLLFNIMDWLGRSLTSYFLWVSLFALTQSELGSNWGPKGAQEHGKVTFISAPDLTMNGSLNGSK